MSIPSTVDTTLVTADSDEVTLDRVKTNTIDDYLGKITSWQAKPAKARFVATVRANIQPYVDSQAIISTFYLLYDLYYAVGDQLDVVGEWVGRSRLVPVPLPNVFFSVGVASLGVGSGYIKGPFDSEEGISLLPDDVYRRLLYAKILANRWDGTSDGLLEILRSYFLDPSTFIIIDDSAPAVRPILLFSVGDPNRGVGAGKIKSSTNDIAPSLGYSLKIGFSGKTPSAIDLAILNDGLIPLKAMGSELKVLVATVDSSPLFGVGCQNSLISGVGTGAICAPPGKVATLFAE